MTNRLCAFVLLSASTVGSLDAAIVTLTIDGQPGDRITQGNDYQLVYHSDNGSTINANVVEEIGGAPSHITVRLLNPTNGTANDQALLRFSSHETGEPLAPGNYPNAVREAGAGQNVPEFFLDFRGQGNGMHEASFNITEIAFSGSGTTASLERLVATFQQSDPDGVGGLSGSINFATAVPEPSSVGFSIIALVVTAAYIRRKRQLAA